MRQGGVLVSTDYTTVCDFCGIKVCGKSDDWPVQNNNWRVSVDNSWFEPEKGSDLYVMKAKVEIHKDACSDCAKKISDIIKRVKPNP